MKYLSLIAIYLLSQSLYAANLEISNIYQVKVGTHQFRVTLMRDNGQREDVTATARYQLSLGRNLGRGLFEFRPANNGYDQSTTLNVSYSSRDGKINITQNTYIIIRQTPDYINIRGPYRVDGRYSTHLYVDAIYNGRSYDLTGKYQWNAYCGRIDSTGQYYPMRRNCRESITFSYGGRTAYFQMDVY